MLTNAADLVTQSRSFHFLLFIQLSLLLPQMPQLQVQVQVQVQTQQLVRPNKRPVEAAVNLAILKRHLLLHRHRRRSRERLLLLLLTVQ